MRYFTLFTVLFAVLATGDSSQANRPRINTDLLVEMHDSTFQSIIETTEFVVVLFLESYQRNIPLQMEELVLAERIIEDGSFHNALP